MLKRLWRRAMQWLRKSRQPQEHQQLPPFEEQQPSEGLPLPNPEAFGMPEQPTLDPLGETQEMPAVQPPEMPQSPLFPQGAPDPLDVQLPQGEPLQAPEIPKPSRSDEMHYRQDRRIEIRQAQHQGDFPKAAQLAQEERSRRDLNESLRQQHQAGVVDDKQGFPDPNNAVPRPEQPMADLPPVHEVTQEPKPFTPQEHADFADAWNRASDMGDKALEPPKLPPIGGQAPGGQVGSEMQQLVQIGNQILEKLNELTEKMDSTPRWQ